MKLDANFLGGLIQPIGNAMLDKADRDHQEQLDQRKNRFNVILSALNNPDLENKETAIDMLFADLGKGAKSKKNGGIMAAVKSLVQGHGKSQQSASAAPVAAQPPAEQPWYVTGESAANTEQAAPVAPASGGAAEVPSELQGLPQLKFTTPEQKAQREIDRAKALAAIEVDKQTAINRSKPLAIGVVVQTGDQIDAEVDADGKPIVKDKTAEYRVLPGPDGQRQYLRIKNSAASPQDRKIKLIADQMKAMDLQNGAPPKTDEEYTQLALVDDRVNTMTQRKQQADRFKQFMALSANQLQRGTQIYQQAEAMFPLAMAAKSLEPALAQARLDALQSRDAERILATTTAMAKSLSVSPLAGAYFGKTVAEVRDKLLEEAGEDPVALAAEARIGRGGAAAGAAAWDDPELKKLAKAALEAAGEQPTDANIKALLSNSANVKALKGGS
jgi:hypothetical protein